MPPSLPPTITNIPDAALAKAALWHAELRDGQASAAKYARWQQWLNAAPEHQAAWQEVQAITGSFEIIQTLPDPQNAANQLEAANRRVSRRRVLLSLAMLGGSGALTWGLWRQDLMPGHFMALACDYRTATGEQREITLADGGSLWLNTASAIDVDYGESLRHIMLRSGEILIDTAVDPHKRPFVVETEHGRLRALGTRFSVRLMKQETILTVHEGRVEILTRNHQTAILEAGQKTSFGKQRIADKEAAAVFAQTWTQGMLVADDMRLGEVINELARYRRTQLVLEQGLGDLKVYGTFPLDDTDQALNMLAQVLKLRIRQTFPWRTRIESKPSHSTGSS